MAKTPKDLRSARWFAPDDLRSMGHRSRAMQMGLEGADWEGKPIIAIINTWSDLSPCHHHLRDRAEFVKKGVYQAGGMPVEMPVHSFAEQFLKPTSMLYRNMGRSVPQCVSATITKQLIPKNKVRNFLTLVRKATLRLD